MNDPIFVIHGKERRKLKKQLSFIKNFVKTFWYTHQIDKDMASFYGGTDTFPMSDEKAQKMYTTNVELVKEIEDKLKEPIKN